MCSKAVQIKNNRKRSKQWCWELGVCGSVGARASILITSFGCLWGPCTVANLVPSGNFYALLLHYVCVCGGRGGLRPRWQYSIIFSALQLTNSDPSAKPKPRNYATSYPSLRSVQTNFSHEQTSFPFVQGSNAHFTWRPTYVSFLSATTIYLKSIVVRHSIFLYTCQRHIAQQYTKIAMSCIHDNNGQMTAPHRRVTRAVHILLTAMPSATRLFDSGFKRF